MLLKCFLVNNSHLPTNVFLLLRTPGSSRDLAYFICRIVVYILCCSVMLQICNSRFRHQLKPGG